MIRLLRVLGIVLVVIGSVVILTWLIKPLREAWPFAIEAFQELPLPIQIGLIVAAVGFTILFSSIIWERFEDRKSEGSLLDDEI